MNGKTKVLTDNGWVAIEKMEGRKINVWNGTQWSTVVTKKTGETEKLAYITIDSGSAVVCSPYTKFYIESTIQERGKDKIVVNEIYGCNLKIGDQLISHKLPVIRDSNKNEEKEICYYSIQDAYSEGTKNGTIKIDYVDYNRPYIPINYNIKTKLKWLAGFLDTYALIDKHEVKISNQHHRFNKIKLYELQLMLHTLGINSCVERNGNSRHTGPTHKLTFSIGELNKLVTLGIKFKKIQKSDIVFVENPETEFSFKIKDIRGYPGVFETYTFKESLNNTAIFDGVLCSTTPNED